LELFAVNCGDKEKTQAETAAAVSITGAMILKRLSMAMTFSQATRSLEMARFLSLSLADNGFFLLRFLGMLVFVRLLCRP
jgi:hypothetical protein